MGENSHQKVIQRYFSRIEKDLDVRAILGELFSKEVLDFDMKEDIDSKDTNKAANTVLANYLHQNADRDKLEGFLKVLESDRTHPKHRTLAKEMREDLAPSKPKGKEASEHAQSQQPMSQQQSRDQPEEKSSHQQATVNSVSKGIVEQPGYSLRPAEDRDLAEQQPDSLEEQNDRPEVECADLDSSENVELPFIDDEVVPEDDLEGNDETTLAEEKTPERPDNTAKKKNSPKKKQCGSTPTKEPNGDSVITSLRGTPAKQDPLAGPCGTAALIGPLDDVTSSLNVVCYPCLCQLDIWRCIKSTGSCKEPSHDKKPLRGRVTLLDHADRLLNVVYCVWYGGCAYPIRKSKSDSIAQLCPDGFNCQYGMRCRLAHCEEELSYWRNPFIFLPPCEICKDCRWECCLTLFQCQCWTRTHSAVDEVVVYKDETQKHLLEIRCPWNYLSMRNKEYHCNHTLDECRHRPIYKCGFPHTEVERKIWNIWNGAASANASSRTARRFLAEIKRAYQNVPLEGSASREPEKPTSITQQSKPQNREVAETELKSSKPRTRKTSLLLTAPLTVASYKDKFLLLNELEKDEHEQALERCNGTFAFREYRHSSKFDRWPRRHKWYGSLEVPQFIGNHVQQAATQVELEKKGGGWQITGDIIHAQKFLNSKYILLVGFNTGMKPREVEQQREGQYPTPMVMTKFCLKYRYFENLQNAILKLPNAVIPKLMLEQVPALPSPSKSANMLSKLPHGFELDKVHQGPTCQQLLRSSPSFPFLITGPFGTGKTRVIAAAAYCIMKQDPQSRILIATHHQRTADEYVENYFTEHLVEREGLEVVRMVSKDTPSTRLSGLTKYPWMVRDTLHNFQLIITTFIQSMGFSRCLRQGHFTHIFIDEAAQAREPETIAAFSVAGRDTKIVIAGDHMQVGPKTSVLGKVPRENGLSDSLLVRLRNQYSKLPGAASQAHQSKLLINYRCHSAIVRLPSRLFYDCSLETQAKSVPHPEWEKMVYFVCSSFDLRAPAAGDKWSTQKEVLAEAEIEVKEVKQLVQKYIDKLPLKRKASSTRKTMSNIGHSEKELSSICVMFPTRLTETLWKREVHGSQELKQVTCAVAYDIQGREFDAIFVCTAQPVNEDYSPFDPVKSMCDPYMFNTIITRPKSLLVTIGNPFRLLKIQQKTPDPPACWLEYLYQCWEQGSLILSSNLKGIHGACRKQLNRLEEEMMSQRTVKSHLVPPMASGKEEVKDGKKDTIMTGHGNASQATAVQNNGMEQRVAKKSHGVAPMASEKEEEKDREIDATVLGCRSDSKATAVQSSGWKLGEETQVMVVKDELVSGFHIECKLDGYTAIPTDPAQKPIAIPSIDERRCAFDGATVVVEETGQQVAGRRTGKVVSVIRQGPVEPMICSVDPLNPLILRPVNGKNPRIVNRPVHTEAEKELKPTKETAVEAMVKCYSPKCLTLSVDAISFKAAVGTFFRVQPLEWSTQERYPVGAVVEVLPKCPTLGRTEFILAKQHKMSQSTDVTTTAAGTAAIGIQDHAGRCTFTFSVEGKKSHFILAVHICNIVDHMSGKEEFKKKEFRDWSASHPILPPDVIQACDFSKTPIQNAITVEFKVEEPMSIFDVATRKNMLLARPSVELVSIRETVVQCSTMLAMSDAEYILRSLQTGQAAEGKLARGTAMSAHDALGILYCTAEHLHKTRHGHSGYPLLEMTSYEFPETEKMVNELLTLANSEVAKTISKAFRDRALLVTQTMQDHSQEEITREFSPPLALLPANYPWLHSQGDATPSPRPFIIFTDKLKTLMEALKRADFLEARQLLYFLHCHPQFAPLQEAIKSSLIPEHFVVGNSPTHFLRCVPYTSITNPFTCIGDVYVQEQLLASVRSEEPPRSIAEVKEVAMHCNRARLNAKDYEAAMARLKWAHFAQSSSLCIQSIVRSMEGGKLQLCCQYDRQGNMQENITVPVLGSKNSLHADYTAMVTSLTGHCQVITRSEYQGGSDSISVLAYGKGGVEQSDSSYSLLVAPQTVQVPVDTLRTVVECISTFDEQKAAKAHKLLLQLEKHEHRSPNRRGPPVEPEVQHAHFLLLECPLPLSPHQLVGVWMRMDTLQYFAAPQPQLLEVGHSNVRVCLHHTEQPEACFTSGSTVQAPQQVHSSVESYVSEWTEVLLAEAACGSVQCMRHILINDVLIQFSEFVAVDMYTSEQFYRPVGEVTALLPKAFMEDRQDIFPLEQGDLLCARYEVDLRDDESELKLLERHGNCFPPQYEPVGHFVLHMVVEKVVLEGTQQEVMMSQEFVQSGVEVYLRVVGGQGGRISSLMRDLLATNRHTCQLEVVSVEPKMRRVYQCLNGLGRLVGPSKLGKDIIFGDLSRLKNSQVPDRPTFAELAQEYPKATRLWYKSSRDSLNTGQRAAVEKAYQTKFHIIRGPPGTEKLVVAVHLAYTFAQKNKRIGVRKATGKQYCVLLCAPDDAAVDTTISLLKLVAGSGEKDIRLLRVYSREVERKHCPGPYQDTTVFGETATVDYRVPQEVERFALHKLIINKMAISPKLEEAIHYSNIKIPSPDQRSEYRQLVAEAERRVIQEGQFDVVLCTCSEASSARIQRHFTPFQCIVYEASLATEPETVAAIARSSHQVALIGDHSSLCPPVCSKVAGQAGLGVSLFERYARQLTEGYEYGLYSFLEEQYRMVEPLCEFPSREFYKDQLKACSTLKCVNYPRLNLFWPKGNGQPLVFCNVRGTEETDLHKSAEDAIVNKREAEKVVDIVLKMVTALSGGKGKFTKDTLAVLTTTEGQKSLIQQSLLKTSLDKNMMGHVRSQVMTISASRGAKANFVILSTVRSCPAGALPKGWTALLDHQWKEDHLGLLCQPHLTCLALTTGKHGLVIVGDVDLLSLDDKWHHLVEHCSDKGCLVQGDTFPSQQFLESLQQAKEGKHKK